MRHKCSEVLNNLYSRTFCTINNPFIACQCQQFSRGLCLFHDNVKQIKYQWEVGGRGEVDHLKRKITIVLVTPPSGALSFPHPYLYISHKLGVCSKLYIFCKFGATDNT